MVLKPRLAAERVTTVYETLERPLIPVIAEMERAGILVDGAILSRLSSTFAQGVARLEEEVNRLVGHKFNLGSPRQLGELLFDRLQLPGGKRTKSGQWETRAGLLDDLAANEELPDDARRLINTMLEWRQLTKLRSTYTDALPAYVHGGTGRIHTCYALGATTTGRLASSEPNLQNIPIRTKEGREIRTAFIAAPGKKLISADYSQIELRVLAHIADIPQLRKAFDEGLDIHAMTASEMFGVPVEGMPARGAPPRQGDQLRHHLRHLGVRARQPARHLARRRRAPTSRPTSSASPASAPTWMRRASARTSAATSRRCSAGASTIPRSTPRTRVCAAILERAAINAPIQGSAADIIRRAMVRMPGALAAEGLKSARMLLQVHDELVFEVGEAEVPNALRTVKKVMEGAALPVIALAVPIHVDAKAADNWEAAH